jgi:hypothetical protein
MLSPGSLAEIQMIAIEIVVALKTPELGAAQAEEADKELPVSRRFCKNPLD